MDIDGKVIWIGGYKAIEEPLEPMLGKWDCPEDLSAMERPKIYTLDKFLPRSCFPVSLSEKQMLELNSRDEDPWGEEMVALGESECCWTCRLFTTWDLKWRAEQELRNVKSERSEFKKNLELTDPVLAKKPYSFTLDEEGGIKIIDAEKLLSDHEKLKLMDAMSRSKNLKSTINNHAHLLIELSSYYKSKDDENALTQKSFGNLIDYEALFSDQVEKNSYPGEKTPGHDSRSRKQSLLHLRC